MKRSNNAITWLALALFVAISPVGAESKADAAEVTESAAKATESVIVQAATLEAAVKAVEDVEGKITHELSIIRAVGADLTANQREKLELQDGLRLFDDQAVDTDGEDDSDESSSLSDDYEDYLEDALFQNTAYPNRIGADYLQMKGRYSYEAI